MLLELPGSSPVVCTQELQAKCTDALEEELVVVPDGQGEGARQTFEGCVPYPQRMAAEQKHQDGAHARWPVGSRRCRAACLFSSAILCL